MKWMCQIRIHFFFWRGLHTVFLFGLTSKSPPEHQSGTGQSEREGKPYARQTPIEDESEEVACRKGDDEVCDESNVHHRFDIGDTSERI